MDIKAKDKKPATVELSDYRTFIEPIRQRMVSSIWRIVRDADDTDDVLQNVLLRIAAQVAAVRSHPNPTALILRMCVNGAIDWHRAKATRTGPLSPDYPLETLHARGPSPGEEALTRERQAQLVGAIRDLPDREAEAIVLTALEGFSCREAAEAMGCGESTVRVLALRARKRLRSVLSEYDTSNVSQSVKEA